MAWLERVYEQCQIKIHETGRCEVPASEETGMQPLTIEGPKLRTADFRENVRAFSQAARMVAGRGACALLAPLEQAQNPYVYMGASVSGGAVVGGSGNVDVVFDLRRKQAAVFTGAAVTVGTQIGVGASAYVGMAFGACNERPDTNLNEAWSTPNCSAGVSISTPFDLLSVDVTAMTSANGCMQGGTIGLGVGVSPDPLPVEGGVSWPVAGGGWNAATEGLAQVGWGSKSVQCRNRAADGTCPSGSAYVQFGSARAMALHLVSQMGVAGVVPAATVLALDQLERRGLTIEQMCPAEVAAERARRTPPEAIQALCDPKRLLPDAGNGVPPTYAGGGQPAQGGPLPTPTPTPTPVPVPTPTPTPTPTADGGSSADAGDAGRDPCSSQQNNDFCGFEIGFSPSNSYVVCREGKVVTSQACGRCERQGPYAYCFP